MSTDRQAMSIKSAAAAYDVSQDMIRKAVAARELPAKKVGRHIRISADALREWFGDLPDASPSAEDVLGVDRAS